ncbi:hypothetical protein CAPTEDRAFT_184536 [Capitella teleta]|uniref:Ancillary SecYEG translocon subunit/Cell division coordinator CpoB TPR domain-containing protein n=1 Tax=Capitella teleta TaxID=283909 RepID=R7TWI1_CAPTE|nr:hypothetical protein CAPTEDRAFT_184536 [Capitella teleta]|eukprot:ELT97952.1 hypothetical protein CAPTEDRAFT_184536 [Capitella teleta]
MNLFDQIKSLYDAELYEDVKILASMVLTLCDHNPELLTVVAKFQILVYQGDAYFHSGHYKKAENIYRKALQSKKSLLKNKGKTASHIDFSPIEAEVKYKLHECYCKMKQFRDAIAVLEGINTRQRTSKINLALARLYQRTGANDRSAVTAYKEVLRECPLSLAAAQGLLALGIKGAEVESLIKNGLPCATNMEWLFSWVRGQSLVASKEYVAATQAFKMLDNKPLLRDNIEVLVSSAEAQFLNGDSQAAMTALNRVHALDSLHLKHMDMLAFLLYKDEKQKELESLATHLITVSESAPEPWVALGYLTMAINKTGRSVYFAKKALDIDGRSVEALLLKGYALLKQKKMQEAIQHLQEALRIAPYRFEAHSALVECYLKSRRIREAVSCAGQAWKQLTNARSLTLYAIVLANEPLNVKKAKGYLETAMKMDATYMPAVYQMAEILAQQQAYDKGIDLLRNVLTRHSTSRLHHLMGDFLHQTGDLSEALNQYSMALRYRRSSLLPHMRLPFCSIDPHNVKVQEAIERLEKNDLDSTYDVEVEDMDGTDVEDMDGSYLDGLEAFHRW